VEVARLQEFDGSSRKVTGFIIVYKLYICMKMKGVSVEEQIQWILSYVQRGSADIWKENIMKELETGEIEFELAEEFLAEIRREFGEGDEELVKIAELKKIKQGGRTMEEFVQDFKRVARGSSYEGCSLIEEFKQGMNGSIRRKLMEAENQSARDTWAIIVIALGLAKEAGDTSTVGSHGTCSNGRSRENQCSHGNLSTEDRVSSKEPIHYGCE